MVEKDRTADTARQKNSISTKAWYCWVIFSACFLMVFTCLGFGSGSRSIYMSAITEALNIKRSLFSINDSIRFLTVSLVNMFFGRLIHKFGERKLVSAGFLCLITSVLLYSGAHGIFTFYVGSILLGIGLAWTTTSMAAYIIKKWFRERSGTILGIVLAANGLGGAISAQIVSPIIYDNNNPFGYRKAYQLVAIILLAVGIVVVSLIRDKDDGHEVTIVQPKVGSPSITAFRQEAGTKSFALYAVCIFLTGTILQSVNSIKSIYMRDIGIDEAFIAAVLSVESLALTAFKFLAGFMYDKKGLRKTLLICDIAAIAMITALLLVGNSPQGRVAAVLFGFLIALALPLETIMLPLITAELFSERAYAGALGIVVAISTLGCAVGGPLINLIYDLHGTYRLALYVLCVLMLGITISLQVILSAKSRKKHTAPDPR